MRSCHNAATEFLRQYWSAVLPTPAGALGAGTASTSAELKAAKADKMVHYLMSTAAKVNAIVHTATISHVDPDRIRAVRSISDEANARLSHRRWALSMLCWSGIGRKRVKNELR